MLQSYEIPPPQNFCKIFFDSSCIMCQTWRILSQRL
nr:MAG TPA: protein of unknown function DUF393 [Caudoviricetes sp.]